VAGAWVGFNDNRVTMRSNYWGQGGHSAILLVGDFFKTTLDAGKVPADAQFPGFQKPAPVYRHAEPEEEVEEGNDMQQEGGPPGDLPQPEPAHPKADGSEQEPEPPRQDGGNRFLNDA
jgi:penicillin-binding protein 1A